jgi:predicted transporter
VSTDPAPDSAFALSFFGRPPGQLPASIVCCPFLGRQVKIIDTVPMVGPLTRLSMGIAMVIAKPAPFVSAFVDAVDQAIREQRPSYGMSAMQRAWLAFCVTAVLVTNSICWARFERASLGTYSLAALSWMFRHSKIPWTLLLDSRVVTFEDGVY